MSKKLTAKLPHVVLKTGQGFNAYPACVHQFLAPLLSYFDSFFWSTCCQFIEDGMDHLEVVARLSEQNHDAQAAHLWLIIEAVAATLITYRVQKALLFPEMQG